MERNLGKSKCETSRFAIRIAGRVFGVLASVNFERDAALLTISNTGDGNGGNPQWENLQKTIDIKLYSLEHVGSFHMSGFVFIEAGSLSGPAVLASVNFERDETLLTSSNTGDGNGGNPQWENLQKTIDIKLYSLEHIGSLHMSGFVFIEADSLSGPAGVQPVTDGVIGLRQPDNPEALVSPLVRRLFVRGLIKEEVFTFRFCGSSTTGASQYNGGDLVFGEIREAYQKSAPVYLSVTEQWYYWTAYIQIGQNYICRSCRSLADSGSGKTIGPKDQVKSLFAQFPHSTEVGGQLFVNCAHIPSYPPMVIGLGQNHFVLKARDYILQETVNGVTRCVLGILYRPGKPRTHWTFGISFLRSFHTIFDQSNSRIGFAKSWTNCFNRTGVCKCLTGLADFNFTDCNTEKCEALNLFVYIFCDYSSLAILTSTYSRETLHILPERIKNKQLAIETSHKTSKRREFIIRRVFIQEKRY
ncbi:cathepsin D [Clonorchis sinensis]|uniref:Cathepsin D n=1 Tax=Clonorchis sinensis TaxID=79923 RepID=H2KS21_CLOSI|nr:cathepsin D [Clonorchis sinensis]